MKFQPAGRRPGPRPARARLSAVRREADGVRIATLLPSATEIAAALGLAGDIVAITHECDYPPEVRDRPVVVRPRVDSGLSSAAIDAEVEDALRRGQSLYHLDEEALAAARPDLIVTQDLCEVCALPSLDVDSVAARLPGSPRVLRLHPHTLEDVFRDIATVGAAAGRADEARRLVGALRARVGAVEAARLGAGRAGTPRVFCMEWLDPPFCSGHWMPEIVERAGGREVLGRHGRPSFRVEWEAIAAAAPEVVVLTVCGFDAARTRAELPPVTARPEWQALPAVAAGQVYATDGSAFFSRSGPRLVDGLEIMAAILHPEAASWPTPPGAWVRLGPDEARGGRGREAAGGPAHDRR
jgi:iron complex transport system substrate-binding protein